MAAQQQKVEDVTTTGDRVKLVFALLVVVTGVVGFYLLREQALIFRVLPPGPRPPDPPATPSATGTGHHATPADRHR